jgi:hydroxymethylglutaryl-CoA reductase (NADPH)
LCFCGASALTPEISTGCSTLVSGTFALLLALFTAYLLGVSINPVILSEALPFLVITVGFEKPFVLAKSVFQNPALAPVSGNSSFLKSRVPSRMHLPSAARVTVTGPGDLDEPFYPSSAEPLRSNGIRWGTPLPARDIVIQAFDKTGKPIVRDYAVEIAVLLAGSFAGVSGLKEFCQLAALILFFDCLFLFGFFASVLTVMVEVSRFPFFCT